MFFCQAVDFSEQIAQHRRDDLEVYKRMLSVPSVAPTGRLPAMVLLHILMRVNITTQILPPWVVQGSTGTIMEIEFSPRDRRRIYDSGDAHLATETCLEELQLAVYIKLDNCSREFLPPLVCGQHRVVGFTKTCLACRAFEGWVLIEPIRRVWTFTDSVSGATLKVSRNQLP